MTIFAALVLAVTLVLVSITDIRERRIPNRALVVAGVAGTALSALPGMDALGSHLLAATVVSAPLFLVAFMKPGSMGMGDAKLVALIGLFLGWQAVPALLIGLALAGLTGALMCLGKRLPPSQTSLPLAPFLAAGVLPIAISGLQALQ